MRITLKFIPTVLLAVLFSVGASYATTITYDATDLTDTIVGNDLWQMEYTVKNDTLLSSIDEVTIWFDLGLYENISIVSTPTDWDPLVVQPDVNIPDNGFFDVLALSSGIPIGDSLGGFTVNFDWTGGTASMSQFFEIIDSLTFNTIDSGQTNLASAPVPEPSTFALLAFGLIGSLFFSRKRF